MGILGQNPRFAVRQLGRNPGFTVTVILTLALSIGANTAIFSVVNALLLKSLPYSHPERMGTIYTRHLILNCRSEIVHRDRETNFAPKAIEPMAFVKVSLDSDTGYRPWRAKELEGNADAR
jgi:hypothetical protein